MSSTNPFVHPSRVGKSNEGNGIICFMFGLVGNKGNSLNIRAYFRTPSCTVVLAEAAIKIKPYMPDNLEKTNEMASQCITAKNS